MKSFHNYFGLQGDIELGRVDNDSNQNISEILSEILTANVDIAKDPYILDINAIQSTLNTVLMMVRWGMKTDTIFFFMNQPIIRDYVEAQALNESVVTDKSNGKLSKNKLIYSVLDKWGRNPKTTDMVSLVEFEKENGSKAESLGRIYDDITDKELKDGIKQGKNANPIGQQKMLDLFLEYQRQSKMFQKMISSTSPDTKGFKGISVLDSQLKEEDEVRESEVFVNYDKIFDESFIGSYKQAKQDYYDNTKDLFLSQHPQHKEHLDTLKAFIEKKIAGKLEKERALQMVDAEFARYIIAHPAIGNVKFQLGYEQLMTGPNSVPKTIKKLKKYFKDNNIQNTFLEQVLPLLDNDGKGTDNLKIKTKRLSIVQKETMHVGFKELKRYDAWIEETYGVTQFSKSLIEFQMIQTGIGQSPFSIMEAIPADDYFAFVKGPMKIASNSDVNASAFAGFDRQNTGEFLLHHPEIFYGKYRMPFTVKWNKKRETFIISYEDMPDTGEQEEVSDTGFSYWQQGNGMNFAQYGVYPEIVRASRRAVEAHPQLKETADANGHYYQMSPNKVTEIRPELEKTLVELLKSIGADVQYVDQITDRNGEVVNAYGKADLVERIVQLTNHRDISTLPEEAAHMITGMLGKSHPLMKQMMSQIDQLPIYQDVKAEYADIYNTEEDFRFEAVGKMIAIHLIKGVPIENPSIKAKIENWFQRLLRKLTEIFSSKDTNKLKNEASIFETVANKILQGEIAQDIADSSESSINRNLRILSNRYNMDDNGVMSSNIDDKALEADLKKSKIKTVTVKKVSNGFVLEKKGKRINPIQEYFQLRETTPQKELVDALVADSEKRGEDVLSGRRNWGSPGDRTEEDALQHDAKKCART